MFGWDGAAGTGSLSITCWLAVAVCRVLGSLALMRRLNVLWIPCGLVLLDSEKPRRRPPSILPQGVDPVPRVRLGLPYWMADHPPHPVNACSVSVTLPLVGRIQQGRGPAVGVTVGPRQCASRGLIRTVSWGSVGLSPQKPGLVESAVRIGAPVPKRRSVGESDARTGAPVPKRRSVGESDARTGAPVPKRSNRLPRPTIPQDLPGPESIDSKSPKFPNRMDIP